MKQYGLFEDSSRVMMCNDVTAALERRDAGGAKIAIDRLSENFGADPLLPAFALLSEVLCRPIPAALGRQAAIDIVRVIEDEVAPAARAVYAKVAAAEALVAPLWSALASAVSGLPFDADARAEPAHAAPLWLRSGAWAQAAAWAEAVPGWRRRPAPLAWKIEALCHLPDASGLWPLFAELTWMAPARAAALANQLSDRRLMRALEDFHTNFEGERTPGDLAWFPAWATIIAPPLAAGLTSTQPGRGTAPERCARLIVELLRLEREADHRALVAGRAQLQALHPALFDRYMQTRA